MGRVVGSLSLSTYVQYIYMFYITSIKRNTFSSTCECQQASLAKIICLNIQKRDMKELNVFFLIVLVIGVNVASVESKFLPRGPAKATGLSYLLAFNRLKESHYLIRGGDDQLRPSNETEEEEEESAADIENEVTSPEEMASKVEMVIEEQEGRTTEAAISFGEEEVIDDPNIDEDSSANVDRLEYADAYDEGDTTEPENHATGALNDSNDGEEPLPTENVTGITSITDDMKKQLIRELKYRRIEAENMRFDVALVVLQKRLRRPVEGIPANWYVDGVAPKPSAISAIVSRIVVPLLAGSIILSAAVQSGVDIDVGLWLTKARKVFSSSSATKKTVAQKPPILDDLPPETTMETDSSEEVEEDKETVPYNEHITPIGQYHPHSVKPGQQPDDELDVTWLDKGITKVERAIKRLFRMEL